MPPLTPADSYVLEAAGCTLNKTAGRSKEGEAITIVRVYDKNDLEKPILTTKNVSETDAIAEAIEKLTALRKVAKAPKNLKDALTKRVAELEKQNNDLQERLEAMEKIVKSLGSKTEDKPSKKAAADKPAEPPKE